MKRNRWLLISPSGEKLKAYQTNELKGIVVLNITSQKITLYPEVEKSILSSRNDLAVIGKFESGKVTSLNQGYALRESSSGDELIALSHYSEEEEERKKPLIGYLKKSAVAHVATLLSLILITYLINPNEPKVESPKVSLFEIKETAQPIAQVKPEKRKVVKKALSVKPIKKSNSKIVRTKDVTPTKTPAILQGLTQSQNSHIRANQMIRSLSQNVKSIGGSTFGANSGGTSSRIGNTGMRASQSGGGSIGSNSSAGYGKFKGGSTTSAGLKIVSNQRGFSLPSGPDDAFSASGLDRDQIIAVINRHRGEITYCYEQALKKDSGLRGKVSIQFVINPGGRVAKANIAESNANSAPLESCMVARLRSWQFPKPVGAVNVDVLYPFHLTKLGQR